MADTDLFELLAAANSQDRGPLADAKAGAGALNSIFSGFEAQKEKNRKDKILAMLDQPLPTKLQRRIFGTKQLPGGMSFAGLHELDTSGDFLKDPSNSIQSKMAAFVASGGDMKKFPEYYKMMQTMEDEEGNIDIPKGAGSLFNTFDENDPKMSPAEYLRKQKDFLDALIRNNQAILSNRKSTPEEKQRAKGYIADANKMLAKLLGMPETKEVKPVIPTPAPAPAAPAPAPKKKSFFSFFGGEKDSGLGTEIEQQLEEIKNKAKK